MRVLVLENRKLKNTLRFGAGTLSIGSSPECAVHLPHAKIGSRQACMARDADGEWWLEVIDTTTPTSLNRVVQKGRARLHHADEIDMGPFTIRLFLEAVKSPEDEQRDRLAALSKQHESTLPLGALVRKFEHRVSVGNEQLVQHSLLVMRIAQSESVRELLVPLVKAIVRGFTARRAWVGLRTPGSHDFELTLGMNDQGQPCDRPAFSEGMTVRCITQSQFVGCPTTPSTGIGSAMAVPLVSQGGVLGMLYVENDPADPPYGAEHLDNFSALACCIAVPIETVLRKGIAKRQALAATEYTIARAAQDALTPKAMPNWDNLVVAGFRQMGSAHCCDFYDIVQLADKSASIVVARLSADWLTVPRCMAEVRAAFRCSALHNDAPHMFARSLNWLAATGESRQLLDLATAWIAPATGKVHYCMAGGGVHLLHVKSDGTCQALGGGPPEMIGKARAGSLDSFALELAKGEGLAFVTNGVATALDASGKVFGLEGVQELLEDGLIHNPGQTLSEFSTDLGEFLKGGACPDDLTVVLLRRG